MTMVKPNNKLHALTNFNRDWVSSKKTSALLQPPKTWEFSEKLDIH